VHHEVEREGGGEGDGPDGDLSSADGRVPAHRGLVDLDDAKDPAIVGDYRDVDLGQCCEFRPLVAILLLRERLDLDLELALERLTQLLVVAELAADQVRFVGPEDIGLVVPRRWGPWASELRRINSRRVALSVRGGVR